MKYFISKCEFVHFTIDTVLNTFSMKRPQTRINDEQEHRKKVMKRTVKS